MRALDDILFGFLIFFCIDRIVRLFSNGLVEPWVKKRGASPEAADIWKLASELGFMLVALALVYRNRAVLSRLNRT